MSATAETFVGGEEIACRPHYGITTNYYNWSTAAKYWELNLTGPSIDAPSGDLAALRSWTRRIIVTNFGSSYTPDPAKADPQNRIFLEDHDLKRFPGSPDARLAYTKSILMPFLQKYTAADCVHMLSNPCEEIVADTNKFVLSMAACRSAACPEVDGESSPAKQILWSVHGGKVGAKFLKPRGVRDSKAIPLLAGQAKERRIVHFNRYIAEYPYLFRFVDETVGHRRLNFNIIKYEQLRRRAEELRLPPLEDLPIVFDLEESTQLLTRPTKRPSPKDCQHLRTSLPATWWRWWTLAA